MFYLVSIFFKVLGFVLHAVPMGIWFAGLPLAIVCLATNGTNTGRFGRRIFAQLPIMLAIGINFGIVPLLFTQTIFYKEFYTATILMAWHWFAVVPILIVGYYAVYLASFSSAATTPQETKNAKKNSHKTQKGIKRTMFFGIVASVCLIAIGALIVNGQTLMVRSDLWQSIMERTGFYGATTGLANNMSDPSVWVRLATVFALGLATTAIWSIVDSHFLLRKNGDKNIDEKYRHWTILFSFILFLISGFLLALLSCLTAMYGISGFVSSRISELSMDILPVFVASVVAFVIVGFVLAAMVLFNGLRVRLLVILAALSHVIVLSGFGIMRQIGQNNRLAQAVETAQSTALAWEAFIPFLVFFVLGAVVVGWMLRQLIVSKLETV
ncbi:MAG: hypothetical protein LBQ66_08810 [Planctomycetaceae bacterium]|jgi:hypothetical protein|nr:hypothetical protein [Planctomycetaceae bacterium]